MRYAILTLLAVTIACVTPSATSSQEVPFDPAGLWVRLESRWKAAPPEIGYEEYTAHARLLRIRADGQLSLLHCLLRRNKAGTSLSPGDGYILFRGAWRAEHGKIVAQYVKADETIPSSDPPFATFLEEPIRVKDHAVVLGKADFEQSTLVSLADYDALVRPVPSVSSVNNR